MESQPQNPEFRNNPENFHLCSFCNGLYQSRQNNHFGGKIVINFFFIDLNICFGYSKEPSH